MNSIQLKPAAQFNLIESGRINLLRRLGWCSKKWSEPLDIETSIIGYLTTKSSSDLLTAAHQQLTIEWWQQIQPQVNCLVSPFVTEEVSNGNPEAANRRLQVVSHLPVLLHNDQISTEA